MFAHLHLFAYIAGGAIVVMVIAGMIGGSMEQSQPADDQLQRPGNVFIPLFGIIFLIFCMAVVPLILRFFTHMQGVIGNGEMAMVKFICQHERTITYVVWSLFAAVLLFSLPTMMRQAGIVGGLLKRGGGFGFTPSSRVAEGDRSADQKTS